MTRTTYAEPAGGSPAGSTDDPHHARRWLILVVIGLAQLMVVLDATIVNIALPTAQHELGFSSDARQWVVTAYALAFGSLLLLGGRVNDLFGRKRAFLTGLAGFAIASAVGGAANGIEMLIVARAAQGVFGALLAPAALSLLTTTFIDPKERGRAFGIFGAIAGGGCRGRPAARWRAHRVPRLALVHARQHHLRGDRVRRRFHPAAAPAVGGPPEAGHPGRGRDARLVPISRVTCTIN
ncbi:sugar phosphate permease [Amycolatopsis thermophila]|uniref:Sugar phosphate permease n=1 Tax=Amycolatopsis thermophila TaxID=206084 RepID=A0ABU0EPN0_9PSEU|nr:sugar phosphate permease [Amycolatopsis thermophila]